MIDLGSLGGTAVATAVNDAGHVVGAAVMPVATARVLVDAAGRMVDLGTSTAAKATSSAVNDSGQVVGRTTAVGNGFTSMRFRGRPRGGMVDLGTLGGSTNGRHRG